MSGFRGSVWCAVALIMSAAGCGRSPAPVRVDYPNASVSKHTVPPWPGLETESAGPFVYYFANGFSRGATQDDRRVGRNEVRFFNLSSVRNHVTFEVFFDNRPPQVVSEFNMDPNRNDVLFSMPAAFADVFAASEAWGARITGTAPLLVQNGLAAGVVAPNGDLWFGDPRYKGGYATFQATRTLSRRWFFPDGLRMSGPEEGRRFQEYEWYHVLNPNEKEAEIEMRCQYIDGHAEVFSFTVNAERVRVVSNEDLVVPNLSHSLEVVSSLPVLVSAERFIADFDGTEDWGAWVHTGLDATPIEEIVGSAN